MLVRFILILVCACVLPGAPSFAQDSKSKDLESKLLKMTHELADSEVSADMPALERTFTDDFTKTAASVPRVQTKPEFLHGLKAGR